MSIPEHVVLIPDGNRRWARAQGKPSFFGHRMGVAAFETIFDYALQQGIPYVTFWGCSINNIQKRDPKEIKFLLQTFKKYLKKLAHSKKIQKNDVRVRVLGAWRNYFPPDVAAAAEEAMAATKRNSKYNLTLLLAYNGDEEMLRAVQQIIKSGTKKINPETIKQNLYTKELPLVDLLVRTGGDPHLSTGFMMWDTQNAELYFTDKMWPEFDKKEFDRALEFFGQAGRRLGK